MAELRFSHEWLAADSDLTEFRETSAFLGIYVDDTCLTRNEDIWSKTVRDTVLVSTYPLALWFASSWWRLNWEPVSQPRVRPPLEWRMAHELGAANHGFVWPRVLFASDGESIAVWAAAVNTVGQSVNYLGGLDSPRYIVRGDFQRAVDNFVHAVLRRLDAVGCRHTDLAELWKLVNEDRSDASASRVRRLEAQLGFDPEECPDAMMEQALELQNRVGDSAMSELGPVYGRHEGGSGLDEIMKLCALEGLRGQFQFSSSAVEHTQPSHFPWQRGIDAARQLRAHIGNRSKPIDDAVLLDLLGLTRNQVDHWTTSSRHPAAIAKPVNGLPESFDFIPRKRHSTARRFEFSRFIGDHLREAADPNEWLASTDLATARQKYQRAFAAEFLCPIDLLVEFLGQDFSESAQEEAADYFGVSEQTVESLLLNNGHLARSFQGSEMPYRLAA